MKGPDDGPRVINGIEIIYGKRSAHDMKSWVCVCTVLNKTIRLLVFDVAPMYCVSCRRPNPNDFILCLANVEINGIPLIKLVKSMGYGEDECVTYAICHLAELMNTILVAISSEKPDRDKATSSLDPGLLITEHRRQFPLGIKPKGGGIHKMIHLLQRLTMGIGVPMKYKKTDQEEWIEHYFSGTKIRVIHCDDFEEVCRQIADGNAILAPLTVGANYGKLEYCQFYTSVPAIQVAERKAKKIPVPGHMVLLIGAMSEKGQRSYFGLEQAGEIFCKQVGTEGWMSLTQQTTAGGGVCKITAGSDFNTNFFKLSRLDDYGLPTKFYGFHEDSGSEEPGVNDSKIDMKFDPEDEGALELKEFNRYLIYHGRYFTNRFKALGLI